MTDQPIIRFKAPNASTVHEAAPASATNLAWCGIRRQFRHRTVPMDTTCPKCLRAIKAGRPQSHKS